MGLFGGKKEPINHRMDHGDGLSSEASLPGEFVIRDSLAKYWHPDVFNPKSENYKPLALNRMKDHLMHGDVQPAVVLVSKESMALVAAYSDEFDAYFYLAFVGEDFDKFKNLRLNIVGKPLLCSWNYMLDNRMKQRDIVHGEKSSNSYAAGWPIIVELLCNDAKRISEVKRIIGNEKFALTFQEADDFYVDRNVRIWRRGTPLGAVAQYYDLNDNRISEGG